MRKLQETDTVPVLDETGNTIEHKAVSAVAAIVASGRIDAVVTETARLAAVSVVWGAVRIDVDGTCYTAQDGGQRITAFAPSLTAAKQYVFVAGNKKVTGGVKKELQDQLAAVSSLKKEASEALSTGKGSAQQVKVASSELAARWANCGNTSDNLVRLLDAAAGLEELSRTTDIGDPDTFLSVVDHSPLWEQPLLLDISFHNIHTFCLELHLDGGYLVQGYQGAYTAMWWEGFTDEPLMLPGMKTDEPLLPAHWERWAKPADAHRKEWGRGRKLTKQEIRELLMGVAKVIVAAEDNRWTAASHELFVSLPFYVGQDAGATVGTSPSTTAKDEEDRGGSLMAVDITVSRIVHLDKALAAAEAENSSLSWAILSKVFTQMVKLAQQ